MHTKLTQNTIDYTQTKHRSLTIHDSWNWLPQVQLCGLQLGRQDVSVELEGLGGEGEKGKERRE
jgi:hypothetical protein